MGNADPRRREESRYQQAVLELEVPRAPKPSRTEREPRDEDRDRGVWTLELF